MRTSRASRGAPTPAKPPETVRKTRPRLLPVEIGWTAWRREWDSNPRYALTHTRFQDLVAVDAGRSEPVSSPRCGYCPSSAAQRTRGVPTVRLKPLGHLSRWNSSQFEGPWTRTPTTCSVARVLAWSRRGILGREKKGLFLNGAAAGREAEDYRYFWNHPMASAIASPRPGSE